MSDFPWNIRLEIAWNVYPGDEPTEADWTALPDGRIKAPLQVQNLPAGQPSESTFKLNNRDRLFDPTGVVQFGGAFGEYGFGEAPEFSTQYNLVPMRHSRLSLVHDDITYPMHRGYVEDWTPQWPEYNQGLIDVRLLGALEWAAGQDMDVDLPAQLTGARINTLLDLIGWPASRRQIADGVVPLDAFEQEEANILQVLLDTNESEDGILFVDPAGDVVFRDRHYLFSTDATIDFGPGGHDVADVDPKFGAAGIVNNSRVEMADGEVIKFVDDESVRDFRATHPYTVRDLPLPPAEAEGLAQWVVVRYAQPHLELGQLKAHGHTDDGAPLAELLAMRIGHLANFEHCPPGGGDVAMKGQIASIEVSMPDEGEIAVVSALASWHGDRDWFVWDDPVLGAWDTGRVFAP